MRVGDPRPRGAALTLLVVLGYLALPAAPAAAAPTFVKTLAGPSVAAMYPSGVEYDDALNRVVLADTGLDRIDVYTYTLGATPATSSYQNVSSFGSHGTGNGQFDTPRDVAIDGSSNIYVGDAGNNRIQSFTSNGTWRWTVGGVGSCDPCLNTPIGVTWDAANNVLLVASTGQDLIKAFDANGNFVWKSPPGTTLGLDAPRDAIRGPDGRIWVSDYKHHQAKAFDVTPSGTWTTAPSIVLGDGLAGGHGDNQLNFPYNVDFSPAGATVYVSDTGNNRVARWDISNPSSPVWLAPVGGDCPQAPDPCPDPPADLGYIDTLRRVVVDPAGDLITADLWGNGLQVWRADGTPAVEIELYAAPAPGFAQAFGVAIGPDGTTYGVDRLNQRIERFGPTGTFLNTAGSRGTNSRSFSWPEAAAVAPDGTVWVADTRNDRLTHWQGNLSTSPNPGVVGQSGSALGSFNYPEGLTVDSSGVIWVADTRNDRIQKYDPVTQVFSAFGSAGSAPGQFQDPQGVAVSGSAVYASDTGNNRIQKLALDGTPIASFSTGLSGPEGVTLAPDGTVWVADTGNNRIVHLSADLVDLGDGFGSAGSGNLQFNLPHSLAVHGTALFVADAFNSRIQVFDLGPPVPDTTPPDGQVTTPTNDEVFTSTPVPMSGTATDNVGVDSVQVAIKDRTTGLWYRANGTWGSFQKQTATLSNPGAPSTTWSYDWTPAPAGSGSYALQVFTTDTSSNQDPTKPWIRFTVSSAVFNPTYDREISDPGGVAPLYPAGGAADAGGNRYIADSGGSRIVKINATGTQTTISSSGWNDPRDIAFDSDDANRLWVADTSDSQIVQVTTSGSVLSTFGGPSVFKTPYGLSNDASGVYVADTYNQRVVKINKSTGAITWTQSTCAGRSFLRPRDAAVGSDGRLYVADTDNNRIAVLNATTGACISAFGSTGSGNNGFRSPRSITSDGAGGLWIADALNYRLKHVTNAGVFIGATSGGFGEGNGQFRSAHCVFLDQGFVDACDTFNYRIQRFSVSPTGVPAFDSILGGTRPTEGGFNGTFDAAYGPSGEMYAADWFNHRVQKFNANGSFAAQWGGYGSPNGALTFPRGVVVTPDGNTVVVTDSENNRIDLFTPSGAFLSSIKPSTGTMFLRPHQTALAPDGTYWVADTDNNRVVHLNGTGTVLGTITNGGTINKPRGVSVDADGNIYVSNTGANRVEKYGPGGAFIKNLATLGGGTTNVRSPYGLRIIGSGSSQKLLIADAGNNRVVVLTLDGAAITTFGTAGSGPGQFSSPRGVGFNAVTGEIAVADFANDRISIWTV